MNFHLPTRDVNGLILTFVFWLHVTQWTSPFHGRVNDLMIFFNDFRSTLFKFRFNFHLLRSSAESPPWYACRLKSLIRLEMPHNLVKCACVRGNIKKSKSSVSSVFEFTRRTAHFKLSTHLVCIAERQDGLFQPSFICFAKDIFTCKWTVRVDASSRQ